MRYPILFSFLLIFITNCSEDIDLTLSSTKKMLVVNGHICDRVSPYNYVKLSLTSDYFNNTISPTVCGANVIVSDGEHSFIFEEKEPGCYMAPTLFAGEHGKTYSLTISNVDIDNDGEKEIYTSEELMPPTYDIDSVKCSYDHFIKCYKIGLYAHEDTSYENYYMFGYSYNDSLISDSYLKYSITDDSYFSSDYCWGATICILRKEKLKSEIINVGDTITVHALSINKNMYDYIKAIDDIADGSNPMFSSTPANAIGNISNGALGFFAVFAVVDSQCLVEE